MAHKPPVPMVNEGTVYKETPPGRATRYVAQIYHQGKKIRRVAATRQEAYAKLRALRTELCTQVIEHQNPPTLAEWRATCQRIHFGHLRPNVRADYESVGRNHIDSAAIGRLPLNQLTRPICQSWVYDLASSGRAYNTVRNARAVLREILRIAQEADYIHDNPADRLRIPIAKPSDDERAAEHTWTHTEVQAFLATIKGHRLEALFYLALTLGARQGELLGLLWPAFDTTRGTLFITRQLRRMPTSHGKVWELQSVKTIAGRRTLLVDSTGRALLLARQAEQTEERQLPGFAARDPFRSRGGLIFTSEEGGPIYGRGLLETFQRFVKKADLPMICFHDLRHTCASLMLADSEPLTTVSAILGHRSPAITATIYAHAVRGQTDEAIARHAQRLRGETG